MRRAAEAVRVFSGLMEEAEAILCGIGCGESALPPTKLAIGT